jgi:CheY-like chemotaxis protein
MAHISRVRPILMLLDFDLPDMNGLEFLKLAKRRFIDLPIIMLTGQNDSETAIEDPPVIVKILSHLGLPTRAPPRAPAQRFDLFQTI